MAEELKTFGVREFTRPTSDLERQAEEIRLAGYTILHDVLSDTELTYAREAIDRIYSEQVVEAGGEDRLARIGDTENARCLLVYDEFFLGVATKAPILALVEQFLGDYYTLMLQNGIINVPVDGGTYNAGQWHRDLNYQHFISTRPLSISALVCVDEFSEETGGTLILPGTHKTEPFPSEDFVRTHETTVNAPAGSAVVFDSMLYHRSGHNRSRAHRRAINHMYTAPFIKQQISLPKMFGGKYRDDPFLRKFLGYESQTDDSVVEFRKRRLRRAGVL